MHALFKGCDMGNFIFSLAIIVGALAAGQLFHLGIRGQGAREKTDGVMSKIRNAVVLFVTPVISLGAFWVVDFSNLALVSVPFIGAATLGIGAVLGIAASKILKHNKLQTGSFFCCGSAANAGTVGGLLCFAFFGEVGYSFMVMYCLLFTPVLYFVSFPGAAYYSGKHASKGIIKTLLGDKLVIIFIATVIVGFALNLLGVERPAFYSTINEYLIPISSFFLVMSLGYTMRFSKIKHYPKEIVIMNVIKYILTPAFVIAVALVFGLQNYGDGTLFKSLIILSAMPVGFNALLPINIYGLDIDLGNSCWIVSTLLLVIVVPALYFVVSL